MEPLGVKDFEDITFGPNWSPFHYLLEVARVGQQKLPKQSFKIEGPEEKERHGLGLKYLPNNNAPEPQSQSKEETVSPTTAGGLPPAFDHPPYSDMICEAIGALKERNGSSKRAIAKYIESAYNDLPLTLPALLTHHLKRLKDNGLLVMVNRSYKLASTGRYDAPLPDSAPPKPTDASPRTKRGRGRPPKPKPTSQPILPTSDPNSQQPVPLADGAKKSPVRPRKNGPADQLGASRGRGRPPKSGPKKSPGRPRKMKTVSSVVGTIAVKRGRGRPPKVLTQLPPQAVLPIQGQPMAVPYADAAAATATAVAPNLPRPRGRPKGAAGVAGAVVPGKRRGRPPKIGRATGEPIEPKKTGGKPLGRPKKTNQGAESKALSAAYGDLKRKLEFFQSKVKQAVGVLKPQFTSESNISAKGAMQELEGLAAMDISTPFKEGAQPPPRLPPSTQPPLVPRNEGQVH